MPTPVIRTIDFSHITKIEVTENGWFDQLMGSTRIQLDDALRKQQITREKYGDILATAIPSMVQEAVKFELSNIQIDLEIRQKQAQLAVLVQRLGLNERKMVTDEAAGAAERAYITNQIYVMNAETELTQAKAATEVFVTTYTHNLIGKEIKSKEVIEAKTLAGPIERALIYSKVSLTDVTTDLIGRQTVTETNTKSLVHNQVNEVAAEITLTNSKTATEGIKLNYVEEQGTKLKSSIALVQKQTATEVLKKCLVRGQSRAECRKVRSYDDTLTMEMVKQQSAPASFAINSGSLFVEDAVAALKTLISSVMQRTSYIKRGPSPLGTGGFNAQAGVEDNCNGNPDEEDFGACGGVSPIDPDEEEGPIDPDNPEEPIDPEEP